MPAANEARTISVQQLEIDIAAEKHRINGYQELLALFPAFISENSAQKLRQALEFSEVRLRFLQSTYDDIGRLIAHGYEDRLRIYVPIEVLNELNGSIQSMQAVTNELIEIPQGSATVSEELPVNAK